MHNRATIIAGCIAGALAVLLLVALGAVAFATDQAMSPRWMVLGILDAFLGMASLRLLGDYIAMDRIERSTSGYIQGVGDTVDRLAAALPPPKDNVRRIG